MSIVMEAGYDYAEFMGKYITALSERKFAVLADIMERKQFSSFGMNAYCPQELRIAGPGFDTADIRSYARLCGSRAARLGTKFIGVGSPRSRNLPLNYSRSRAVSQLKEFLKITADELDRYGITVCLEPLAPCYCNFINRVEEAVEIVEEIQWENIRVVLDFYNMEQSGESIDNDIRGLPYIAHVHISEDDGSPDRRYYLKKENAQKHQSRIQRLVKNGYNGTVSLEMDLPARIDRAVESLSILINS